VTEEAVDAEGVASVVLNLTKFGALVKVPLMVTVVPTAPLVGENVGTPGQVLDGPVSGPVVKVKAAESPELLCRTTVVEVAPASVPGRPTSSWVSASIVPNVPAVVVAPWWNVTVVTGPPLATSW